MRPETVLNEQKRCFALATAPRTFGDRYRQGRATAPAGALSTWWRWSLLQAGGLRQVIAMAKSLGKSRRELGRFYPMARAPTRQDRA